MKLQMFSIFDAKASAYLPPWFVPNVPVALRSFSNCANTVDHAFCLNAEDYTLFHLGTFDSDSGKVDLFSDPHVIGKALQFKRAVDSVSVPSLKVVE